MVVSCSLALEGFGQATLRKEFYMTNGTVHAVALSGDTLFVGGDFTEVAAPLTYATSFNVATGFPDPWADRPNNWVQDICPDGQGGWFLAGNFSVVGTTFKPSLARLDAGGQLMSWSPGGNGLLSLKRVLLAGSLLVTVDSDDEIQVFDVATGAHQGWSAGGNGTVEAIAVKDQVLYIGGDFTTFEGMPRQNLAAINLQTGSLTSWNVACNGRILTVAAHESGLVIGGEFNTISGFFRNKLALLDYTTALPTSWDPDVSGDVHSSFERNDTLFIGGDFSAIGGTSRGRLAAFSLEDGALLPWAPIADGVVYDMSAVGSSLFICGDFNNVNSSPRGHAAAIGVDMGDVLPWEVARPSGDFFAVSAQVDRVYLVGSFTAMGAVDRENFACFSLSSGAVLPWSPAFSSNTGFPPVTALHVHQDRLFVGGSFDQIDGIPRTSLAEFQLPIGQLTSWNPTLSSTGRVLDIDSHGGRLYIAGSFSQIEGQNRPDLASFNLSNLDLTAWNPTTSTSWNTNGLAFHQNRVYVANFLQFPAVEVFDTLTGLSIPWITTGGTQTAFGLTIRGDAAYFVGQFSSVNGVQRNGAAACDVNTGALTSWDPGPDCPGSTGTMNAVASNSVSVFMAGCMNVIGGPGGTPVSGVVALDQLTGAPYGDPAEFNLWPEPLCLFANDTLLVVGGSFEVVERQTRQGLAVYSLGDIVTDLLQPSAPSRDGGMVSVWPSPSRGEALNVMFPATKLPMQSVWTEVFDMQGRLHASAHLMSSMNAVDGVSTLSVPTTLLDTLGPGAYLLRLRSGREVHFARFSLTP
ncbi:MAG: PQQ-like beta-propeller repeat protein [Flavobacteriales bacterium]|nr:PQQ-like beta-propeller repeat protein [Flavobacteriales bacterium]